MTARHDKATELAATVREALDSLERIGGGWYGIKPTRAALDALEALATGKATEGRTEAAAVDQAIADVRKRTSLWAQHDEMQTMVSREFAESLRVLADAVEELRLSLYSRDILLSLANGRLEAAEAERDRWLAWSDGNYPDDSPGDVIAAEPDGTITLDDAITTWNPKRAAAFFKDKGQT